MENLPVQHPKAVTGEFFAMLSFVQRAHDCLSQLKTDHQSTRFRKACSRIQRFECGEHLGCADDDEDIPCL